MVRDVWLNFSVAYFLFCASCFRCGSKIEELNVDSWTKRRRTNANSRRNLHQGQFLLQQNSANQRNQVRLHINYPAAAQTWITCGTDHRQLHWRTVKTTPPHPSWQTIPAPCLCLPHTLPLRLDLHRTTDKTRTVPTCLQRICIWIDLASSRIPQHICNEWLV